jgi:hypothetical protein
LDGHAICTLNFDAKPFAIYWGCVCIVDLMIYEVCNSS